MGSARRVRKKLNPLRDPQMIVDDGLVALGEARGDKQDIQYRIEENRGKMLALGTGISKIIDTKNGAIRDKTDKQVQVKNDGTNYSFYKKMLYAALKKEFEGGVPSETHWLIDDAAKAGFRFRQRSDSLSRIEERIGQQQNEMDRCKLDYIALKEDNTRKEAESEEKTAVMRQLSFNVGVALFRVNNKIDIEAMLQPKDPAAQVDLSL